MPSAIDPPLIGWLSDWLADPPASYIQSLSPAAALYGQVVIQCPSSSSFVPKDPSPLFQIPPTAYTCKCRVFSFLYRRNADKMSSRVKKTKSKTPHPKTIRRDALLELILQAPITIKRSYAFYKKRSLSCEMSLSDSSRYVAYINGNQSLCDAQGVTIQQLRYIASQYSKLEAEIEEAENKRTILDTKINYLCLQKKIQFEKMTRAISRRIDTIEELEHVECEEVEAAAASEASANPSITSDTPPCLSPSFIPLQNDIYPEVPLEPSLLAEFGLLPGSPSSIASLGSSSGNPIFSQGSRGSQLVPISCLLGRNLTISPNTIVALSL